MDEPRCMCRIERFRDLPEQVERPLRRESAFAAQKFS
jgi:hypothetical protein